MSKNILLNLILFFISLTCKAQWTPIGPYGGQIDDMIAINDTLFAASPNGVFKSLNNGNNWVRESEGLSATFNVSKFLYHDSILYIGTDKGLYLYQPNERKWC